MSWVLFYDGECAFCSRSVRQLVAFDRQRRIFFAPLQGKLAAEMNFTQYAAAVGGTVILFRESDGRIFKKSDALVEITRALGGGWRLLSLAHWIPRPVRDFVYDVVANNRQRLAKNLGACPLADPELLSRLRD